MNYSTINELQAKWKELEEKVTSRVFQSPTCPLACLRIGGKIRLCYNGKPMAECSAEEKVTAAEYVHGFLRLWAEQCNNLEQRAKEANRQLADALGDL